MARHAVVPGARLEAQVSANDKIKQRRLEFIRAIAEYLTSDMGAKSIRLSMGNLDAKAWAKAFQSAGCHGWPTTDEAEEAIKRLFPTP